MTMRTSLLSSLRPALACSLTATLIALTGCSMSMETAQLPAGPGPAFALSGIAHGGEQPISGATVSLYETSATGVATNGVYVPATALTPLGTTTTDLNGNYSFPTALTCASSTDYVYATAAGGNSGANAINPNLLLMAAGGLCSNLSSSTFIQINELTTVAAAYSLQGFTSVTGSYTTKTNATDSATAFSIASGIATIMAPNTLKSGEEVVISGFTPDTYLNGTFTVISATATQFTINTSQPTTPLTNEAGSVAEIVANTLPIVSVTSSATNYTTASATAGSQSAAGLAHAFKNAASINNVATGQTNPVSPSGAIVPGALISSLANSLQTCVNSTGGTATNSTTNDGTLCGKLFSYTTSPATPTTPPTNTLAATLNVARFPTQNVASIWGLASAYVAFYPSLTAAPNDWSLALSYTRYYGATNGNTTTSATNGLYYPYHLTIDYADNVYVSNTNASSTTQSNVLALGTYGNVSWSTAVDTTTNTAPRFIATDALGNVFLVNNGSTAAKENIVEYNTANGTVEQTIAAGTTYPFGIAVDSSNNLWVSNSTGTAGSANIAEFTCGSPCGTNSTYTLATFGTPASAANAASTYAYQPVIDANKNVWLNGYKASSAAVPFVLPYTAPVTGPPAVAAYAAPEVQPGAIAGVTNYGIAVDSSDNGWISTTNSLYKLTSSGSGATLALSAGTAIPVTGASSMRFINIDGNNTLWVAENSNNAIVGYPTTATSPAPFLLKPCISNTYGACPSSGTSPGLAGPRVAQVDSTGSVWVASSTDGVVMEIVGAAAPTWPVLAYVKQGLMP